MSHEPIESNDFRASVSRRALLAGAGAAAVSTTMLAGCKSASADGDEGKAPKGKAVKKGNINQSIVFWCYNLFGEKWTIDQMCGVAKKLGCKSVELVDPKDFPTLKKHGLICAITPNGMPGAPFVKGLNNLKYHEEVIGRTMKSIDATSAAGFPNVIAFNGYKWRDAEDPSSGEISREEGAKNCVTGLKKLAVHAEKKNVTICIEHLNTRDGSTDFHGHPGYQGDDIDYVFDIVKQVGSPRVKVLFDIYHVQIMDGDIIRRLKQYRELVGHVHTAGNPGRCELDKNQEINYPGIMRALVELKYDGYVGQEFIPTRDAYQGLYEACRQCDV